MEVFSFTKRDKWPGSMRPSSIQIGVRREGKLGRHFSDQLLLLSMGLYLAFNVITSKENMIWSHELAMDFTTINLCLHRKLDIKSLPICVFLDDLIYANLNCFIFKSAIALVLVYSEFSSCHCFPMRNLSQIKPEFFVMPSLVRKILVSFNWRRKKKKEGRKKVSPL